MGAQKIPTREQRRARRAIVTSASPAAQPPSTMTHAEWIAEGHRRFGADLMKWAFVCPSCGHVAKVEDWKAVGAEEGEVAFSCVGRHSGGGDAFIKGFGPCNYAGGGLFRLNPVTVIFEGKPRYVFAFADIPGAESAAAE